MPGAGTLVAANAVYRGSKPDGLTVLNMHGGQVLSQILGRPGVGFDARKFVWVGAPARVSVACALTRRTGIATVGDWAHAGRPIKLGGIAPGDSTHDAVRILQATLGLPIQLVRGYKGTADIRLAAESGEVAGGCWQWESMKATWRNALETGDVRVVLQVAATPLSDLPGVPNALDLAPTPDARRLLSSGIVVPTTIARLYALPPATPRERVATLRAAFLATLRDPKFLADARRANLEVDPVSGEEVERLVGELFHLDSAVVARLREILR
jgi:tripartite-type tricarboxylate transporter receptor subunit TctC